MIKIFRNIRKSLLNEGKTSKYFRYAIGEIILVVVGILIALQINNWNEERKDKVKKTKMLMSLQEDFQSTRSNLKASLDYYPVLRRRLERQIKYLGFTKEEINDSVISYLSGTFFPNTEIIEGSLNVILSSDNLQLISSNSLKKHLTAYPSYLSSFKEQEFETKNLVLKEHRPIVERHISLTDWFLDDEKYPDLRDRAIPSDFVSLVNDHDFQNVLVKEIYHIWYTTDRAKFLLEKTDKILESINEELKSD